MAIAFEHPESVAGVTVRYLTPVRRAGGVREFATIRAYRGWDRHARAAGYTMTSTSVQRWCA